MKIKNYLIIALLLFSSLFSSSDYHCPFCDNQVIESQLVYKGNYWIVMTNYKPILPGHLLIVPIAHRATRHELSKEEHDELYSIEAKIRQVLQQRFGPQIEDFQHEKNGPTLQSVYHFHIHVLPIDSKKIGTWWSRFLFTSKILVMPATRISDEEQQRELDTYKAAFANRL